MFYASATRNIKLHWKHVRYISAFQTLKLKPMGKSGLLMNQGKITFILWIFFFQSRFPKKPHESLHARRNKIEGKNSVYSSYLITLLYLVCGKALHSDLFIAEIELLLSDYLVGFVAFACYQDDVVFAGCTYG